MNTKQRDKHIVESKTIRKSMNQVTEIAKK